MQTITTKTQAIELFGSRKALYTELGITAGALTQWPEELTFRQINQVLGAAYRTGRLRPEDRRRDAGTAGVKSAGKAKAGDTKTGGEAA